MVDTDVEEEEQRTFFPLKNTKFLPWDPNFSLPGRDGGRSKEEEEEEEHMTDSRIKEIEGF